MGLVKKIMQIKSMKGRTYSREKIEPDPYPVILPLCRVESAKRG